MLNSKPIWSSDSQHSLNSWILVYSFFMSDYFYISPSLCISAVYVRCACNLYVYVQTHRAYEQIEGRYIGDMIQERYNF